MKLSLKKVNRLLLYLLGMTAALVLLYFLDTRWTVMVDTKTVVVAAKQLLPHEPITEDDLMIVRIKEDYVISGAIPAEDAHFLVGQEALQLIEAGDQMTDNRVDKTSLLSVPGATVVELPDDWILSVPGSLRRLDRITIFAVPSNEEKVNTETGASEPLLSQAEKVAEDIVVAYYKDAGSNEVKNAEENVNPNVRVDATVRGRKLELQLTPDQLKQLSEKAASGYQFIVGYGS
ncbi:SAF domain-containing protein [Paenibacillus sinopodophylli]|uniref:SAF domain-containing protein n=1 Tax=Paenibacillus sinopodophylli TaxID=1837342 RepID=UPI00110CA815|nr:SAF domain-containing protein [Paenibacillus sinopodophylli]